MAVAPAALTAATGMTAGTAMGLGLGADALSSIFNVGQQQQANSTSQQIANSEMQWEQNMSDTAHQREVADLKAAGINPILTATGGSGASTPPGIMPSIQAPQVHMPDMMSYGISLKQLEQADQKIAIDRANSTAAIAKNMTAADLDKAQTLMTKAGIPLKQAEGSGVTDVSDLVGNFIQYMRTIVHQPSFTSTRKPSPVPSSAGSFENSAPSPYPTQLAP